MRNHTEGWCEPIDADDQMVAPYLVKTSNSPNTSKKSTVTS